MNYQLSVINYEIFGTLRGPSETSGDLRELPGTFGNLRKHSKTFENLLESLENLQKPLNTCGNLGFRVFGDPHVDSIRTQIQKPPLPPPPFEIRKKGE